MFGNNDMSENVKIMLESYKREIDLDLIDLREQFKELKRKVKNNETEIRQLKCKHPKEDREVKENQLYTTHFSSYNPSFDYPNGKEYFEECKLCGKILNTFDCEKDYIKALSQNLKDKAKKLDQDLKDKNYSE